MALGRDPNPLHNRDLGFKDVDIAAISAIAQAAIDVELFTIPLYMTSLYSIQGMHQITSQGNDFYKGRLWPGPAPSADPKTANEKAFNIIFSVFIQEMLHLQLASNIATAIGVTPAYTGPALQNADHGWICYGPTLTVIRISSTSRILRSTRTSASISARCPRISSSSSSRSKSRRRWRLHRPRQARQILPGVTLRQLAAETTVANVRHDRLDVPVLQELSRHRIQRRQHAVGGVVQRGPEEGRAAERLVQQVRRRRPIRCASSWASSRPSR